MIAKLLCFLVSLALLWVISGGATRSIECKGCDTTPTVDWDAISEGLKAADD